MALIKCNSYLVLGFLWTRILLRTHLRRRPLQTARSVHARMQTNQKGCWNLFSNERHYNNKFVCKTVDEVKKNAAIKQHFQTIYLNFFSNLYRFKSFFSIRCSRSIWTIVFHWRNVTRTMEVFFDLCRIVTVIYRHAAHSHNVRIHTTRTRQRQPPRCNQKIWLGKHALFIVCYFFHRNTILNELASLLSKNTQELEQVVLLNPNTITFI